MIKNDKKITIKFIPASNARYPKPTYGLSSVVSKNVS